jgi:hypothetical protein
MTIRIRLSLQLIGLMVSILLLNSQVIRIHINFFDLFQIKAKSVAEK